MAFIIRATGLGFLLCVVAVRPAVAEECPDLPPLLLEVSGNINQVLLEEAQEAAEKAHQAIHCQSKPVSALTLSLLYQLTGALHTFLGNEVEARAAYEWAFTVAPTQPLDPHLGSVAEEAYNAVRAELMSLPNGTVLLKGDGKAWIDGRSVPTGQRLELSSGPHLLQWQNVGDGLRSREIRVVPAEVRELPLQLPTVAAAETSPKEEKPAKEPRAKRKAKDKPKAQRTPRTWPSARPMKLAGGVLLATSGGLMAKWKIESNAFWDESWDEDWDDFPDSTRESALGKKRDLANRLYASGLATGSVGVGLLGAGFVLGDEQALLTLHGSW
jgi:hypothetical protein